MYRFAHNTPCIMGSSNNTITITKMMGERLIISCVVKRDASSRQTDRHNEFISNSHFHLLLMSGKLITQIIEFVILDYKTNLECAFQQFYRAKRNRRISSDHPSIPLTPNIIAQAQKTWSPPYPSITVQTHACSIPFEETDQSCIMVELS
jgi:hypothetical protein